MSQMGVLDNEIAIWLGGSFRSPNTQTGLFVMDL